MNAPADIVIRIYEVASHTNFQMIQSVGVIASLLFAGFSFRLAVKAQRVTNLFQLTSFHRQLYGELFDRPQLRRVFSAKVNLEEEPVTPEEQLFVTMMILHLNLALEAQRNHVINRLEGLRTDAAVIFNNPIPRAIWSEIRVVQNKELRAFVDSIVNEERASTLKSAAAI